MQKKRQEDKGAQTTGQQTTNQQSAISGQLSAKSETQSEKGKKESDNRTTGLQDQEAQRKEQSDDRPQTTELQTTNQQSAISGQPSAKQNTERQGAVGSEQSAGLQDQEAKSEKQQKDYEPDITGPLSPVRTDLGTPLAADRIW